MNKRMFVAISLSSGLKKNLFNKISNLQKILPTVNFTDELNLHLTLKYLGDITDEELYEATEVLKSIAEEFNPFEIEGRGVLAFPSFLNPKVLAFSLKESELLQSINKVLSEEFEYRRMAKSENKKFIPHITIAMLKKNKADVSQIENTNINFKEMVSALQLFETDLSGIKPVYNIIQNFEL